MNMLETIKYCVNGTHPAQRKSAIEVMDEIIARHPGPAPLPQNTEPMPVVMSPERAAEFGIPAHRLPKRGPRYILAQYADPIVEADKIIAWSRK